MPVPPECAREGCKRLARYDEYCSTYCLRRDIGTLHTMQTAKPLTPRERANQQARLRRLKKKHGVTDDYIEVKNEDAMTRIVPGSFESGKRR